MFTSEEVRKKYNLALIYKNKDVQKSIAILEGIIKNKKNKNDIHIVYNELGTIYANLAKLDEARSNFIKAIELKPNYDDGYNNLGTLCTLENDIDSAINYYIQALELNPVHKNAVENLIKMYVLKRRYDELINICSKILDSYPENIDALYGIAVAYYHLGYLNDSEKYFKEILDKDDNNINASMFIADIYNKRGKYSEAALLFKKVTQLSPVDYRPHNDLGNFYKSIGDFESAKNAYKNGLDLANDLNLKALIYSNYLLMINYMDIDNMELGEEHSKFNNLFNVKDNRISISIQNINNTNKRIKIGYVSADFRQHSVAYFIYAPFILHNKDQFELYCYSDVKNGDYITERFQEFSSVFRDINGKSHQEVAEIIRKDDIDILVDLAGHTGTNRLPVFAEKPAKLQISWIGYPNTTGLKTIDYRIVDEFTDPLDNEGYSEELIRIPDSFLCYTPLEDAPLSSNNHNRDFIRFASFNNYSKVTDEVILNWIKIIENVPNSKLLLKDKIFGDKIIVENVQERFKSLGMDLSRLELMSWAKTSTSHLDIYNQVDIGLDTYPYNGTTTTCEAIYMGVPVVTLAGEKHSSRVGLSLLSNIGLNELVTFSSESYIQTSVNLALDLERLRDMKESLRGKMKSSSLMDAKKSVLKLEQIYKFVFYKFCLTQEYIQLEDHSLVVYMIRMNNLLINNIRGLLEDINNKPREDISVSKTQLFVNVEGITLLKGRIESHLKVNSNLSALLHNIDKSVQLIIKLYNMGNYDLLLVTIERILLPALENLSLELSYYRVQNE